jgi:hypothetical protein
MLKTCFVVLALSLIATAQTRHNYDTKSSGGATINPTNNAMPVRSNATTFVDLVNPTTPDGVAQVLTSTPSAGVGQTPVFALSGVPTRAVTAASDTILVADRGGYISYSNAGAIAVTLPQAGTTGFGSNFVFVTCGIGTGTVTITPTTSTISYSTGSAYTAAAASMPLTTGQCAWIYSDNINYFAIQRAGGGGSAIGTVFHGICTGATTPSTTGSFTNLGGQGACSGSVNTGSLGITVIATNACTLKRLYASSGAAGFSAGDGVMKVWTGAQSGAGSASGITCTIGTGTTCNDTTHTLAISAGTLVEVTFDAAVGSTLTYMSAAVECD